MSTEHETHQPPPTTCAAALSARVCVRAAHTCPMAPSCVWCHGSPSTEVLCSTELYLCPTTVVSAQRCCLSPSTYAQTLCCSLDCRVELAALAAEGRHAVGVCVCVILTSELYLYPPPLSSQLKEAACRPAPMPKTFVAPLTAV